MTTITLPAPAKLNLMLRITGRRADGYHDLQSVFQFIDHGDVITLSSWETAAIERIGDDNGIAAEDDLVVRAARLLQQETGCRLGARISVDKQLPMGAGLGGGSSDAATVLHGLNRLWGCGLTADRLAETGLKLGADVPVFVHGFAAFAEGVGEQLTAVDIEMPWYLVITPQVHVSTAEIFAASELTRDCPALKICDLFGDANRANWMNVCTPVVVDRYPEVARALRVLGMHADSRMSGTGSSVFAAFDSEQQAWQVADELRNDVIADGWQFIVAKGLNRSPLLKAM